MGLGVYIERKAQKARGLLEEWKNRETETREFDARGIRNGIAKNQEGGTQLKTPFFQTFFVWPTVTNWNPIPFSCD